MLSIVKKSYENISANYKHLLNDLPSFFERRKQFDLDIKFLRPSWQWFLWNMSMNCLRVLLLTPFNEVLRRWVHPISIPSLLMIPFINSWKIFRIPFPVWFRNKSLRARRLSEHRRVNINLNFLANFPAIARPPRRQRKRQTNRMHTRTLWRFVSTARRRP